jgi:hypothetical protein
LGTGLLPRVKWPKCGFNYPSPSSAEVKESVELYLYTPLLNLYGLFGKVPKKEHPKSNFAEIHSMETAPILLIEGRTEERRSRRKMARDFANLRRRLK